MTGHKLLVYLRSSGHNGGVLEHVEIGADVRDAFFFAKLPEQEPITLFGWLLEYYKKRGWMTDLVPEKELTSLPKL